MAASSRVAKGAAAPCHWAATSGQLVAARRAAAAPPPRGGYAATIYTRTCTMYAAHRSSGRHARGSRTAQQLLWVPAGDDKTLHSQRWNPGVSSVVAPVHSQPAPAPVSEWPVASSSGAWQPAAVDLSWPGRPCVDGARRSQQRQAIVLVPQHLRPPPAPSMPKKKKAAPKKTKPVPKKTIKKVRFPAPP